MKEWPKTLRIAIEPSFSVADGLFFSWQTTLEANAGWNSLFDALILGIRAASSVYKVNFLPLAGV
ncbi:MAG: hypothetical protein PHC88_15275 [Terrimicrobiaceae bacterium]|nr:hypothetical protein [Terrimicrobiaceae bacterium]